MRPFIDRDVRRGDACVALARYVMHDEYAVEVIGHRHGRIQCDTRKVFGNRIPAGSNNLAMLCQRDLSVAPDRAEQAFHTAGTDGDEVFAGRGVSYLGSRAEPRVPLSRFAPRRTSTRCAGTTPRTHSPLPAMHASLVLARHASPLRTSAPALGRPLFGAAFAGFLRHVRVGLADLVEVFFFQLLEIEHLVLGVANRADDLVELDLHRF